MCMNENVSHENVSHRMPIFRQCKTSNERSYSEFANRWSSTEYLWGGETSTRVVQRRSLLCPRVLSPVGGDEVVDDDEHQQHVTSMANVNVKSESQPTMEQRGPHWIDVHNCDPVSDLSATHLWATATNINTNTNTNITTNTNINKHRHQHQHQHQRRHQCNHGED